MTSPLDPADQQAADIVELLGLAVAAHLADDGDLDSLTEAAAAIGHRSGVEHLAGLTALMAVSVAATPPAKPFGKLVDPRFWVRQRRTAPDT